MTGQTGKALLLAMALVAAASSAMAGPLVVVPAAATVRQTNDRALLLFSVEEQDRDKAAAAASVNRKMKEGVALIRRLDPRALLRTRGYSTAPVYPDEAPLPPGVRRKPPVPVAWRVSQTLEVITPDLAGLAHLTASAQALLALNGIEFSLSEEAARKLDEQRLAATWRNLTERIGAIARAMGREPADAVLESLDFDGVGERGRVPEVRPMAMSMRSKVEVVDETSFEPGETTLEMRAVGKVRFK